MSRSDLLQDAGDLTLPEDGAQARSIIEARVRTLLDEGRTPLVLGGDHSITYPVLRAWRGREAALTVLHFDAHSDLYDDFEGDRYSHACPFARALEEGLMVRLVQVGIRCMTAHLRAQVARFGVEVLRGQPLARGGHDVIARLDGPVYISLDLDVLEPMLAPGLSHPEPGGLSVREVVDLIGAVRAPVVGADVVEYNPRNDVRDLTARVAAKFVKELIGAGASGAGSRRPARRGRTSAQCRPLR